MNGLLPRILLAGALLAAGVAAPSQTAPKDAPKPAANAWMLTPTPYLAWNKDITASVRAQRDRFWDELSGRRVPLTAPPTEGEGSGCGTFLMTGDSSDIRSAPDRVVLTAAFTKYQSVLSASELSLYTEVTMHVDEVFDDETGSGRPFAGQDITLLLNGGTIALPSGGSLSHHTTSCGPSLQPNHRYLLVLSYQGDGNFYLDEDDWDISDGTVRPNTVRTQAVANDGHSSLSGLTIQQLGPALDGTLHGAGPAAP